MSQTLPSPLRRPPASPERAQLLLEQWRRSLHLSGREASGLQGQLAALDRQLQRLRLRQPRLAVYGRVGVGKSSLLNALLGRQAFATDVAHGCTRHQQAAVWHRPLDGLSAAELVDTPGLDEIGAAARARLARRVALGCDLVLMVLDADLSAVERQALDVLLAAGKPVLLVLNRSDCWPLEQRHSLLESIRRRLPPQARQLELVAVAAAPRQARLLADGRVRSEPLEPRVAPLERLLIGLLESQGDLLLAINSLRAAERFHQDLQAVRLRHSRRAAQGLIGRFAALKAAGVAANPLVLLDLAGGLASDAALVMQLCQLYGLPMEGARARHLLTRLSGHNALLGGAQLGLQALLGAVRQLLLVAAPLSGGLSLAPAAPVAVAQAALAVHTTRRTGRLAALELVRGARRGGLPGALLRRLAASDPEVRHWLGSWPERPVATPAGDSDPAPWQGLLP